MSLSCVCQHTFLWLHWPFNSGVCAGSIRLEAACIPETRFCECFRNFSMHIKPGFLTRCLEQIQGVFQVLSSVIMRSSFPDSSSLVAMGANNSSPFLLAVCQISTQVFVFSPDFIIYRPMSVSMSFPNPAGCLLTSVAQKKT